MVHLCNLFQKPEDGEEGEKEGRQEGRRKGRELGKAEGKNLTGELNLMDHSV